MSSSNTTPFNNRRNVLGSNEKLANYVGKRSINTPRNTSINYNKTFDNDDIKKEKNDSSNLSDSEKKQRMSDYANKSNQDDSNGSIRNQFGPKNRLNNTANNLRDSLNTKVNDIKDDAVKKGAEALKKSANPYAKAAGYAASFLQKRKEKKEEKNKEEEKDDESDNKEDNNDTSQNVEQETKAAVKKITPILMIIAPLLLIFLLFIAIASPVLNAYSWFYSIFNHNSNDAESYYVSSKNEAEQLAQEKAFNDAIVGSSDGSVKGIIQEYQEKYGVTLDKYLLIATVTYRYTAVSDEKLYTDDGNEDIDEEEFSNKLDELDEEKTENESEENTSDSNNKIDYKAAEKKIAVVASMMIQKNGDTYTADNTVGGAFYNTLIDSKFLKSYYKSLLKDQEYETRKKLVDEIFEYAEGAREIFEEDSTSVNGGVVGDTSVVYLQSCTEPKTYQTKFVGNHEIYDNKLVNEGTNYPLYLSLKDYIKGVIYRENFSTDEKHRESVKVQAIMALSFLLKDSKSGFDLKTGEMYFPTETCRQATCDPNNGCSYVDKVASYSGTDRGVGTSKRALNEKEQAFLDSILDEVFGLVIVKKGVTSATFSGSSDLVSFNYCSNLGACDSCHAGSCVGQSEANSDSVSGMDYKAIFAKYFTSLDYDIINIKEGLYFESTETYNGTINLNESFHYHQSDSPWGSQKLCGSESISGNGCNITSAAIAISLLKNQRITPETLNNRQKEITTCNSSSRPQMIMDFARLYGLKPVEVRKDNKGAVNDMLNKLSTGNYVAVVRLTPGTGRSLYPSGAGHYMTIVGVKTENGVNKVLVWNTIKTQDNRWVDVNDLTAILRADYSFILIGR